MAPDEDSNAPIYGELTCEGCLAPVFMVRQGNWKLITCRTDPDQLYNLADDPHEHTNLANDAAHADTLRKLKAMAAARWNPAQLEADIRESQLVRLTVWHACAKASGTLGITSRCAMPPSSTCAITRT
jgi:choline-sulfatase